VIEEEKKGSEKMHALLLLLAVTPRDLMSWQPEHFEILL